MSFAKRKLEEQEERAEMIRLGRDPGWKFMPLTDPATEEKIRQLEALVELLESKVAALEQKI